MEKTFSDLIKPHQKRFDYHNQRRIYIDKADVLKLLQKVREATIDECVEILANPNIQNSRMVALKTDRIKLTEKP